MPQKRKSSAELLAAARECVLAHGARRTTLTEVARRAGVSRPTIYSRWPDVRALLADLITTELAELAALTELPSQTDIAEPRTDEHARARLVNTAMRTSAAIIADPLMLKILDTDPEMLLPYVFQRFGTSQKAVLDQLETAIVAGQTDGSIRSGDVATLARMTQLAAQSVVLSHRLVLDVADIDRLVIELGRMLDGYLKP